MGTGSSAQSDLENYRAGYPDLVDDPNKNDNYMFYSGQIQSVPQGDYIDNIHKNWWGNVQLLEVHHGYIQWLFPIREHGMNYQSSPIQKHEIEKIKNDKQCYDRLIKSYELMLDFYGCRLKNKDTGEIERNNVWKERYHNLNTHGHNFLRITRILKCLGEFGLENYQKHFLLHFIEEIWTNKQLQSCASSCSNFWIGTVKNDQLRAEIEAKIPKTKTTAPQYPHHHHQHSHTQDNDSDEESSDDVMDHTKVDQAEKEAMLKDNDMPSEYTKLDTGEEDSPVNEHDHNHQNNQTPESHHSTEPPKVEEQQSTHTHVPHSESTENQAQQSTHTHVPHSEPTEHQTQQSTHTHVPHSEPTEHQTQQSHHVPEHNTSSVDPHSSSTTQQPSNS